MSPANITLYQVMSLFVVAISLNSQMEQLTFPDTLLRRVQRTIRA